MTDLNNSKADQPDPKDEPEQVAGTPTPEAAGAAGSGEDDLWASFEQEHADDLQDIADSKHARRFERHIKRQKKKALLSVDDLDPKAFTGGSRSKRGKNQQGVGPRDFTGTSWLDTDDVMDTYGDDFVPPNISLGHFGGSRLVFWILFLLGIAGLIASVLLPNLTPLLGTVFGLFALLGGGGLLLVHKGFSETKDDYCDDGARV
ncbi:hypothetical protein CRD60_03440 [Bifidobacterium aemilianum]|uniref:Membrane associated protein n=1 Tax=Bifidobacterium aemilianum TaxID=2493120 RepID=A0A366K8Z1_9BIFI|nr:hypothetical protein [Bifidobacterium aemilianum]RBP98205.1 hypothetical protein CRD60_03440 [Bifidobacterium aemilianum]